MKKCRHEGLEPSKLRVCRSADCHEPIKLCCNHCVKQRHDHHHPLFLEYSEVQQLIKPLWDRTMHRLELSRKINEEYQRRLIELERELDLTRSCLERSCDTGMPLSVAQSLSDMMNGEFLDEGTLAVLCAGELLRCQEEVWLEVAKTSEFMPIIATAFDGIYDFLKRKQERGSTDQPRKIVHLQRVSCNKENGQKEILKENKEQSSWITPKAESKQASSDGLEPQSLCNTVLGYSDQFLAMFESLNEALFSIQNYCSATELSVGIPTFPQTDKSQLEDYSMLVRLIGEFEDLQCLTLIFQTPLTRELLGPINKWLGGMPNLQRLSLQPGSQKERVIGTRDVLEQLTEVSCAIDIMTSDVLP